MAHGNISPMPTQSRPKIATAEAVVPVQVRDMWEECCCECFYDCGLGVGIVRNKRLSTRGGRGIKRQLSSPVDNKLVDLLASNFFFCV
jgi:hypothetical protein